MDFSDENIKISAQHTISIEEQALKSIKNHINQDFIAAIKLLYKSKGRVVVSGIGKSAIIGTKIVATLNSTGTPALFMHAADAIHGDLGMIQEEDVLILLSKSGESPEIKFLLPIIKNNGNKIIAIVGNTASYLAQQADHVLNTTVPEEACPNNLAPTASTIAQMAMGDALAISLLELKGFTAKDFAKYHPGGTLGKKLYLRVEDISIKNEQPSVNAQADLNTIILEISSKRLGATAVVNDDKQIVGIITDGDLRRMLAGGNMHSQAKDIMNPHPKTIQKGELIVNALDKMRKNNISQIIVKEDEKYIGMIHIHDLIKEGLI